MKRAAAIIYCVIMGCADPVEELPVIHALPVQNVDTSNGLAKVFVEDTATFVAPLPPAVKPPAGVYKFTLSLTGNQPVEHIVSFSNNTYVLQEKYKNGNEDSVVITKGMHALSDGYIWLYNKQVVRGRYSWKGDTLQYFSPKNNRKYSMMRMPPVTNNAVFAGKKKEGITFYGVGTEPFWSVELMPSDTLVFNNPEWTQPLKMKLTSTEHKRDKIIYTGMQDSVSLQVKVSPYFCSDGMSDFIYSHSLQIKYNGKTYTGCGVHF